ncbi:putative Programmed cell death protein, partial [Operophtera brumata]
MTMGDELPVTSLVLPVLIRPVLSQLEKYDSAASQTLRAALTKAEAAVPGLNYDLVAGIMRRADIPVNMNESLLRLQGTLTEAESFQELNKKSASLKKILSRIPDEITDRKTFLETIKEIASAIKKLLDAVNEVSTYTPGPGKQVLEQRKREFVNSSTAYNFIYFKAGPSLFKPPDVMRLLPSFDDIRHQFRLRQGLEKTSLGCQTAARSFELSLNPPQSPGSDDDQYRLVQPKDE